MHWADSPKGCSQPKRSIKLHAKVPWKLGRAASKTQPSRVTQLLTLPLSKWA